MFGQFGRLWIKSTYSYLIFLILKAQNCSHFGCICSQNCICVTFNFWGECSRLLVHNSLDRFTQWGLFSIAQIKLFIYCVSQYNLSVKNPSSARHNYPWESMVLAAQMSVPKISKEPSLFPFWKKCNKAELEQTLKLQTWLSCQDNSSQCELAIHQGWPTLLSTWPYDNLFTYLHTGGVRSVTACRVC